MQINKNQAIEISLKDLFFHILYRWRSILIAALVGAVVVCGYQYMTIKKVHDAGKLTEEERQYQINLQNYKEDLENAQNTIRINTKLLQGQNAYRNESIYIQLDPQSVWTASNKYLVRIDQSVLEKLPQGVSLDPADSVLPAYTSPLSEATEDELKEVFGTEKPEYISELVATNISTSENSVTVTVKAATKEMAQAGIALLNEKMVEISEGKVQEIEKHKLSLVSENVSLRADDELPEKQEGLAKSIKENQEELQEARKKLDKLEADGEPQAPSMHLTKMAVIGFIFGALLLAFLYAVLCVINGRLKSARNLAERYELPIFGEFASGGILHSAKGINKLISKWERGKNTPDDETVYDNIAALIAEKQEAKNILLASTLPVNSMNTIKEELTKRLPNQNINLQADLIHNSKAIAESVEADAVIITEAKDVSSLKEMDRMVENLIIAEANVIGAIVL